MVNNLKTLKEPPSTFLLYLRWLTCCSTETSWLFSFELCTRLKTIFVKIEPRVMTLRRVIARWVKQKFWFSIEITHKSCFCLHCALPLCFILFIWFICSKNVCKHSLAHIIAKTCNCLFEKIAKNDDFGDFKRFSRFLTCVTYDVTVTNISNHLATHYKIELSYSRGQ